MYLSYSFVHFSVVKISELHWSLTEIWTWSDVKWTYCSRKDAKKTDYSSLYIEYKSSLFFENS